MFSDTTTLVAFLFRIINFGVLLFLAFILYKRSVRKTIDTAIAQENQEELGLIQTTGDLKSRQGILSEEIKQQAQLGRSMADKISAWRTSCRAKQQEQVAQKASIRTIMAQRIAVQTHTIELQTLEKTVKPLVLAKTQAELTTYFSDQTNQKGYLNDIISYLKKEAL